MPREQAIYVGLSSSLGDRVGALRVAIARIRALLTIEHLSGLYITLSDGKAYPHSPISTVLRGRSIQSPLRLNRALRSLEEQMGRKPGVEYGPQPITIELLFYGQLEMDTRELILPYPQLPNMPQWLKPLAEFDAALIHPTLTFSIRQLLLESEDHEQVIPYGGTERMT